MLECSLILPELRDAAGLGLVFILFFEYHFKKFYFMIIFTG